MVSSYCYDHSNRLVGVTTSDGNSAGATYDADGNRTQLTYNGQIVQQYAYNADQYTTPADTYDGVGNFTATADGSVTYTYNGAGQMTQHKEGANQIDHVYAGTTQDELLSESGNGGTRRFAYGRTGKTGLPLPEIVDVGAGPNYYVFDPQGTPLALATDDGQWAFLAIDGLGSVQALVNQDGVQTASYAYTPFGPPQANNLNGADVISRNVYTYAGGILDSYANSHLLHLGARYYDYDDGRFTQLDSITTLADPTRANRYMYAGDNPVNYVDPTGRDIGDFVDYVLGRGLEDALSTAVPAGIGGCIVGAAPGLSILDPAVAAVGCGTVGGDAFVVGFVGGFIFGAVKGAYEYFS